MSTHTPGPWEVWPSLYEGMGAAVVHNDAPVRTIAEVRKYRDAVLIAAAPELYEALKRALPILMVAEDNLPSINERIAQAEAALRKAEGL